MKQKVCVFQSPFCVSQEDIVRKSREYVEWEINTLDACNPDMDIIVLPEGSDILARCADAAQVALLSGASQKALLDKASETARRCHALVFVNCHYPTKNGIRNTTLAFGRDGEIIGKYYKQHLTRGEEQNLKLDASYTYEYEAPYILTVDGIRFAFLTCYDFYFYEMFSAIAKENVDIIIGCSQQKSDTLETAETITKFLAYNTCAYVLRSCVAVDNGSNLGGGTMIVGPDGLIIENLGQEVGTAVAEIDPHRKYLKPGGFGNPDCCHWQYIEQGRRPWKYRQAGSSVRLCDKLTPYPRTCAHRGFPAVAPEGTMPGFGAAVALGAEEIEFDVWWTRDGELVVSHDRSLERCSNGTGLVTDYTYAELLQFDFGCRFGDGQAFKGLKIPLFEEVLAQFACRVIMNIHIKTGDNRLVYDVQRIRKIAGLIHKYGCEDWCYFMTGNDILLRQLKEYAPGIKRCVGAGDEPDRIVQRAIELGCEKVQLFHGHVTREMTELAHSHGIICNVYYADTPDQTEEYLAMGCDVILTNDCNNIKQVVDRWREGRNRQG